MRQCEICGKTLPDEDFSKSYKKRCKHCVAEMTREKRSQIVQHIDPVLTEVDLSNCSEEYRKAYYDGWNNCNQQHAQLEAGFRSAWSEEDERNIEGIISEIEANKNDAPDYDLATYDRFLSWLKSLKDRVQQQPKQEWSEEDERERERVVSLLKGWLSTFKETYYAKDCKCGVAWLESIKERMKGK